MFPLVFTLFVSGVNVDPGCLSLSTYDFFIIKNSCAASCAAKCSAGSAGKRAACTEKCLSDECGVDY